MRNPLRFPGVALSKRRALNGSPWRSEAGLRPLVENKAEVPYSCPRNTDHRDRVAQFLLIRKAPHKDDVGKFTLSKLHFV